MQKFTPKQRDKFRQEGIELYEMAQIDGNTLATDLVKDHARQIDEWEEGNREADEPASVEVMAGYSLAVHGFPIDMSVTQRGFSIGEFRDRYEKECSIQKSSLAGDDCIWFGIDDPTPEIMASDTPEGGTGWVPYSIPKEVSLSTRMHLTRDMVRELLPVLRHFVNTGDLPSG